jgi:endoglucanase
VAVVVALLLVLVGCTGGGKDKDADGGIEGTSSGPVGSWEPVGPTNAVIRVDQVGFVASEPKVAWLLAKTDSPTMTWKLERGDGKVVNQGELGPDTGNWNAAHPVVRPIDFSEVTGTGTYRIRVGTENGTVTAVSPAFRIGPADEIFDGVTADLVKFFTAQRDGADVTDDPLPRKPSHLHDKTARVYEKPSFGDPNGTTVEEDLEPVTDGPTTVDAEGGWFDAGDYLKFTHTTAYALSMLLLSRRGAVGGSAPDIPKLDAETAYGLDWLDRMWDGKTRTLYIQVGVGSGADSDLVGDHDTWRLPETDDAATGDANRYLRNRPVFRATAPGEKLSPNLAGRVAAAFALAAQVEANDDPAKAKAHLAAAAQVLAQAETTDVGDLVTVFPNAYYGESSWTDDMAFGATELALAGRALHDPRASAWIALAASWAKNDLALAATGPLNLYDTGPVAYAELAALLKEAGTTGVAVTAQVLTNSLRARLQKAVATEASARAQGLLGIAEAMSEADWSSRTLGWVAVAGLYREVSGDDTFRGFEADQRGLVLGGNGWGVSMIVGVGSTYPRCPHHQIANLAGRSDGRAPIDTGAVVNGPNKSSLFDSLGKSTTKTCKGVNATAFDRADIRYVDKTYAWPSNEPAIDFTGTGVLAIAVTARTK